MTSEFWRRPSVTGAGAGLIGGAIIATAFLYGGGRVNAPQFVTAVAQLLWPISVITVAYWYREEVRVALGRLQKAEFPGVKLELIQSATQTPPPPSPPPPPVFRGALPFFGASIPGFVGLLTGRGPFSPALALIPGRSFRGPESYEAQHELSEVGQRARSAMEIKILKTLWTKQVNRFPRYDGVWTFRINSVSPEFLEYHGAVGKLMRDGLVSETDQGQIHLTPQGLLYCKEHYLEFTGDEFFPDEKLNEEKLREALAPS
jgi:hypothetical protein